MSEINEEAMRTFTNKDGREFRVALDFPTAKRIRDEVGVNILAGKNGEGFKLLADDPIALLDAIYVTVQDQCDACGMTYQDFGRSLDVKTVGDAVDAFMAAFALMQPDEIRDLMLSAIVQGKELHHDAMKYLGEIDADRVLLDQLEIAAKAKSAKLQGATTPTTLN
ncbi:MAG: hypothetical protein AAGI46_09130 [Planctomycetota bacterium]